MKVSDQIWKLVFEETALVTLQNQLPAKYDDKVFEDTTKAGDWLPRLQLMTAASEKCKDGSFPMNHYALASGQNLRDVGQTVDVLVLSWRPKAMDIGDEIITIYDPENPEFNRIREASGEKDSGCMYGPEFLIYIPSAEQFATFFMGSKSARREAPSVKARMLKAGTLKSNLVKTAKYTWQTPTCVPCSTPFELPGESEIKTQVEKFLNPPTTNVEKASEADKANTDRAR